MKNSNKTYYEEISSYYEPHKEKFINNLEPINFFQRGMGFKEFSNIMIICLNANTNMMKYLKKHGINYKDTTIKNPDRALVVSLEQYFYNEYLNALNEFYDYIRSTNAITDSLQTKLGYKLYDKLPYNSLTKRFKLNYTEYIKTLYNDSQEYVYNFKDIEDKVFNFELKDQYQEVIESYFPILLDKLSKNTLLKNAQANYNFNIGLFVNQTNKIKDSLNRININYFNSYIDEYRLKLIKEDILNSKALIKK